MRLASSAMLPGTSMAAAWAALLVRSFTITEGPDGVARLPYWADRADHVARTPFAEITRPAANNNSRTPARIAPPESMAAEWLTLFLYHLDRLLSKPHPRLEHQELIHSRSYNLLAQPLLCFPIPNMVNALLSCVPPRCLGGGGCDNAQVDLLRRQGVCIAGTVGSGCAAGEGRSGTGWHRTHHRARSSPSPAVPGDHDTSGTSSCVKYPGGSGAAPRSYDGSWRSRCRGGSACVTPICFGWRWASSRRGW